MNNEIIIIASICGIGIAGCIGSITMKLYYNRKYGFLNDPVEFRKWLDLIDWNNK
ncbi:MAG: hypothetical protein L0H53_00575 [Candidatus Nitrosocosmicus sp.]|nr:hypothetical protein [Candidatus Nitrosocosmicus sp.]MDN5866031.1 hypothetical protein [Candidatus Nitrosocosmicus sp.]